MPKKRKTRQQKKVTDLKRQDGHQVTSSRESSPSLSPVSAHDSITFSLPTTSTAKREMPGKTAAVAITTNEYGYLKNDLLKTAFLTIAISITELIIRFMFRG